MPWEMETQGEDGREAAEAETGGVRLQAKECPGLREVAEARERQGCIRPWSRPRRRHVDFRLLDSRTVRINFCCFKPPSY